MRRLLVLFLLLMLPFQGALAVVSGITALDAPCAALQQAALHGEDDRANGNATGSDAGADLEGVMVDCDHGLPAEPCCDGHCSACHGHGLVALVGLPLVLGSRSTGSGVPVRSALGAPDHIPELPLRPPL
ncbi:MAG: hypothetical protein IPF94_05940 [Betaproteobacteria bacterium]|nr:hypothetical protein [Betaproteobacteria bacterium]